MKVIILILSLALISCSRTENITTDMNIPEALQDCSFHRVADKDGTGHLYVVRCPHSDTTTHYKSGKSNHTITVIDPSQ